MALGVKFCLWAWIACATLNWRSAMCQGLSVYQHPDAAGLLALKSSICGEDCPALASWNETSRVCSPVGFDGVYCALHNGQWRVVSVTLQLEVSAVSLDDAQLSVGGVLQGIEYLRELELLCYKAPMAGYRPQGPTTSAAPSGSALHSSMQLNPELTLQASRCCKSTMDNTRSSSTSSSHRITSSQSSEGDTNASLEQSHSAAAAATLRTLTTAGQQTGELPARWFVAYPQLQQLRVTGCGARGRLPPELLSARQLSSLVLSRNNLKGSLPEELVELQRLTLLDLSGNKLSGTLPAAWAALPELSYLYLNQNNLTLNTLPCEWADMLSLTLADISGNRYKPISAGATAAACQRSRRRLLFGNRSMIYSKSASGSSSSSGSLSHSHGQNKAAKFGVLRGPRCWLRRFCYLEGVFICLQRSTKHPGGGCTSYIYGASDLHVDPANQCDHGGTHLVAIAALWVSLLGVLLLIYLHHCRMLRRITERTEQQRRQQQQQPWHSSQRQWLVSSGPATSPRSTSAAAAAANEGTLPLLYYAASSHEDAAGYTRPASPGACSVNTALSESEGLPSALQTPPIFTTRLMVVRGLGSAANSGYDSEQSSPGAPSAYGPTRLGRTGGSRSGLNRLGHWSSDLVAVRASGAHTCFSHELLLPLAFALIDIVTDVRLLVLWGVRPHEVKLWPSYVLLGLVVLPHVLVGAVAYFRLLAIACLPPAVQAAAAPLDADILPPGSWGIIYLHSWLFSAPWWFAYPLISVLLLPGIALLSVLCPFALLLHAFGVSTHDAIVRYVQLMQACVALTEAPGAVVLLTVLFLMGNVPLEYAFLDSSLYYLNIVASMMDIAVAWWVKLQGVRQRHVVQLSDSGIPPAGIWS